jgi:hypothetical protein
MNRGRKITQRGGISKQPRINNASKNKPITRTQSKLFQEDRNDEHSENFVLIQLSSNKKLLVNCFTDLLQLNEKEKIKMGSSISLKMNNQQSALGTVFFIGQWISKYVKIEVTLLYVF